MPNNEVRVLDLSIPDEPTAAPFPAGSAPMSVEGLNYIWVYIQDVETNVETHLRFKVVNRRMILRSSVDVVERVEAEFRRTLAPECDEIAWRATMIHYPMPGVAHIEPCVITVGDNLEVDIAQLCDESQVAPKVALGVITKIMLAMS